jgi:hypothetical protein
MGKRSAENQQLQAEQNMRLDQLEEQQQAPAYAAPPPQAYAAPPPQPAATGLAPDAIDQLKQLAELKQQGILTDEEFEAQKAKILGT